MALVAFASLAADSLSEDDFVCENVAAKLEGCCEDFDPKAMQCHYGGCSAPEVSRAELDCIESFSCEEIVDRDLCARVITKTNDPMVEDRLCH